MNIKSVTTHHEKGNTEQVAEIRSFLMCEYIVLDKKNRFSLINIFDRIFFKELPSSYPFKIFVSFIGSAGSHEIKLVAENAKDKDNTIYEDKVTLDKESIFTLTVEGLFDFTYFGKHFFSLYLDGQKIGRTFLNVDKVEEQFSNE